MKINNSNPELGTAAITTSCTETTGTVNVAMELPGTGADTLVHAINQRVSASTFCTAGLGQIATATSESPSTGSKEAVGAGLLSTTAKVADIKVARTLSEINAGVVCSGCNIADIPETRCTPPGLRTDLQPTEPNN